jgi:hypothetical protein
MKTPVAIGLIVLTGGVVGCSPRNEPEGELPAPDPTTIHNLRSTTFQRYWVVYAWTDAKGYRPQERIQLTMRFLTETDEARAETTLEVPTLTATAIDGQNKVVDTERVELKLDRVRRGHLTIYTTHIPNLFPQPGDDPKRGREVGRGPIELRLEFKTIKGETAVIDGLRVTTNGGRP